MGKCKGDNYMAQWVIVTLRPINPLLIPVLVLQRKRKFRYLLMTAVHVQVNLVSR